jgi:hypothetical protein
MKWSFEREAWWMMWLALVPALFILWALIWPYLRRTLG